MNPRNIFSSFSLATAIFMLLLTGCKTSSSDDDSNEVTITPVTLTHISVGPIADSLVLNAVSGFLKESIVRASATGIVETVTINPGDKVEKGQLLFTLKTKEAAAYDMANTRDSLLAFKGLIRITSPANGVVVSILHQRGDYIQEGDELAHVSDLRSFIFTLEVPFELRNFIAHDEKCRIVLTDGRAFEGIIGTSLPVMNIQSQTESFVVHPVTTAGLPGNLIAKVLVPKHLVKNAVLLPKEAVLSNESLTEFWIMKLINDSVAVKIPVQKGLETDNVVQIVRPLLSESDRIILTGNYGLSDTARISIK